MSSSRSARAGRATARHLEIALCSAGLGLAPVPAWAQATPAAVSIESGLQATDNGALASGADRRSDLIGWVRPGIAWRRRSAGLDVEVDASATLLGYANGTQPGGILPNLRASLKATLVERWLSLDAAARVRQSEADPFGARVDNTSGANRTTQSSYLLAPTLEHPIAPDTSLLGRHEASLSTNGAGSGAREIGNRSTLRVARAPLPFGTSVEWTRLSTETRDASSSKLTLQALRVAGSVALAQEWVIGVLAGQERSRLLLSDQNDPIHGVDLQWKPSPRTALNARVEHRFFGTGGSVSFTHRNPFLEFGLSVARQPVVVASSLGLTSGGIRSYLDSILATDIVANYPQLQTSLEAHLTLLGRRDTVSATAYAQTARQLTHDGDPLAAAVPAVADSRQRGGAIAWNRRLGELVSGNVMARWSRIDGLAALSGDASRESVYQLKLVRTLSPRTAASVGAQHARFSTTLAGQPSYRATTVFTGLGHRF
jgi:hypothetical protein